jgi:hypothetical protein
MTDRKKQTNRRQTRLKKPSVEQMQVPASAPQVQGSPAGDRSSLTVDAAGAREASAPRRSGRSAAGKGGGGINIPTSDIELLLAQEIGPSRGCGANPGAIAEGRQPSARKDHADRVNRLAARLDRGVSILSKSGPVIEKLVPDLGNEAKDSLAGKLHHMRELIDEMLDYLNVDAT